MATRYLMQRLSGVNINSSTGEIIFESSKKDKSLNDLVSELNEDVNPTPKDKFMGFEHPVPTTFGEMSLPMVRRVYVRSVSEDLVAVKPMKSSRDE